MASMRLVTRKPPNILIPARNRDIAARMMTRRLVDPICSNAPNIIIDEIALVTAISGVCRE
tara:strand:- start:31 stop:213 length:183 start_codon:yes stop_codon:yes gene_type:complete